jgi:gamma-glutamyltranspeptidase/glutathione hydrolase
MAALHARYGRLNWSHLLAPAENLARFGFPTSRALATSIAAGGQDLMADRGLWRIVVDQGGRLRNEGQTLQQPELADTLASIRLRGTLEFPASVAAKLVAGSRAAGGTVTDNEIRNYAAVWRPTLRVSGHGAMIHFPPPPVGSGERFKRIWQALGEGDKILAAEIPARPAVVATAAAKAGPNDDQLSGGEAPASTAFAVADGGGNAVACALTMNKPFGVRQVAKGTGIVLAANPSAGPDMSASLMPVVVVNRPVISLTRTASILYTAAAGIGDGSPANMALVLSLLLGDEQTPPQALSQTRVLVKGRTAFYEAEAGVETKTALRSQGYVPKPVASIGRINIIHCAGGLPDEPQTCQLRSDPRGYGMGAAGGY